jgi:hypothetical protein
MTSLEADPVEFERAKFNIPFKCIEVENCLTTNYISNLTLEESGTVMWLDYTSPQEIKAQFEDYSSMIQKMHDGDVIKITLNASPSSLGNPQKDPQKTNLHEYRKEELTDRLGDFAPDTQLIATEELYTDNYPLLLLRCLEKTTYESLSASGEKTLLPLLACAYDDGTQMLTFTGVVCRNKRSAKAIKNQHDLKQTCLFSWDKVEHLCVPPLTIREMDAINKLLPSKRKDCIKNRFKFIFKNDNHSVQSYIRHYQHYPNYHDVSF